ncbi:MAG: hypothetical protein JNM94_11855 [Phycisphaerae bacterium]|nr:hypothetical protein [Phycisphaerae bacterium]
MRRLAETVVWCSERATLADPQHSVRTEVIRPDFDIAGPEAGFPSRDQDLQVRRARIVNEVARRRSRVLAARSPSAAPDPLQGGRLLLTSLDASDWSALPAEASQGFFDEHDCPGWDTWLDYFADGNGHFLLLSWVPPHLVDLAEAGIRICAMDNLTWVGCEILSA